MQEPNRNYCILNIRYSYIVLQYSFVEEREGFCSARMSGGDLQKHPLKGTLTFKKIFRGLENIAILELYLQKLLQ